MALVDDWSFSCLGVTAGQGTNICPAGPIRGLGSAPMRTFDAPRGNRAGDVAGQDTHGSKLLAFPVLVRGDGGTRQTRLASAMTRAISVVGAWGAAVGSGEVECEVRLPGFPGADSTLTYYGRPFETPLDLDPDALGHIPTVLAFRALDPYGYRPAVTTAQSGGTITATNDGTAATDRAIFTITGDIGGVRLEKASTGEAITFTSSIGVGATINLRTGAVLDSAGNDVSNRLAAGPLWFDLDPGANIINVTGGQAEIAVQSAYNI